MTVTHRQRIDALLKGKLIDRPPVALWRHFPVDDQNPEQLAKATVEFQRLFDFDLIKITPASSFQIKDWGARDIWKGNPEGSREYLKRVIQVPEDWNKIKPLKIKNGWLADQLDCASLIVKQEGKTVPILQTVFSPLAQAKNLAGNEQLINHIHEYPDAVLPALDVITATTIDFVKALAQIHVDGIFFAVQHAQYSFLTEDEFIRFGRAYDLQVLNASNLFNCNMLHIHGENILFNQVRDYPVQIINWHDQSTPPSLKDGLQLVKGSVCGGLNQWHTIVLGDPKSVIREAYAAIEQTNGIRFLLGTGCVTPITAPFGNIMATRHAFEG